MRRFAIRKQYGIPYLPPEDLLVIQRESFNDDFLQIHTPHNQRANKGLEYLFRIFFPIAVGPFSLEYVSYTVGEPVRKLDVCRTKHLTYEAPITAVFRLVIRKDTDIVEVREQQVPIMTMPIMTSDALFVISGVEKVVLSQIVRAPGVIFTRDKDQRYTAKILPEWGAWLRFGTNRNGEVVVHIDTSPALPVGLLFRAFGASTDEIAHYYSESLAQELYRATVAPTLSAQIDEYKQKNATETPDFALAAQYDIYRRLKPNTIPTVEHANRYFDQMFYRLTRYDLSTAGRINLNRRTKLNIDETVRLLDKREPMIVARILASQLTNKGKGTNDSSLSTDTADSLENKIVKTVGRQLVEWLRNGFLALEKHIIETLLHATPDILPEQLIISSPLDRTINKFFNSNSLCQFGQHINILSDISQKRRIAAIGIGGLDRDSATIEARDVQPTQYGRICPIESPEGKNIGLVMNLATYARVDEHGKLLTPYRIVRNGQITERIRYLRAEDEKKHVITDYNAVDNTGTKLLETEYLSARRLNKGGDNTETMDVLMSARESIDMVDVSPYQLLSPTTALIPFVQHCDGHRALMGASMMKQAVPLLRPEAPMVGTGMEKVIAANSPYVVTALYDGTVEAVDAQKIVIRRANNAFKLDVYRLKKFRPTNQGTCINQKPIVKVGDKVKKGDLLADCHGVRNGELALGRNVLVAYMSWYGQGFEDSIVISERLLKHDLFTSIHIKQLDIDVLRTRLGNEYVTKDVPNVAHELLRHLDDDGIVRVGSYVQPGDYLVGKVMPRAEDSLTPEERLLRAVFGNTASQVEDVSLTVPLGADGYVIDVQILDKNVKDSDSVAEGMSQLKTIRDERIREAKGRLDEIMEKARKRYRDICLIAPGAVFIGDFRALSYKDACELEINYDCEAPLRTKDKLNQALMSYREQVTSLIDEYKTARTDIRAGDELPAGVLKRIIVTIAQRRKIEVGDKMAGRYGNKGIVSIIVPEEDMPYMEDGTPIDIVLNPLGVPSRMNIGQVLEAQMGMALWQMGQHIAEMADRGDSDGVRAALKRVYTTDSEQAAIDTMTPSELYTIANQVRDGIPIASPAFVGAREQDIWDMMKESGRCSQDGKYKLYDGRTGLPFDREVLVGRKYMLKLYHLVKDKIHARSVGPYSTITQQPIRGRAKAGGQRVGEMEVWALEGYGAAYTLREMLTVKSDDMDGRQQVIEQIVRHGKYHMEDGQTEALQVLMRELRGLCLDVEPCVSASVRRSSRCNGDRKTR